MSVLLLLRCVLRLRNPLSVPGAAACALTIVTTFDYIRRCSWLPLAEGESWPEKVRKLLAQVKEELSPLEVPVELRLLHW